MRIKDLTQYVGALIRGDIFFMIDGNAFVQGMKMSGQQIYDLCKGADGRDILIRNNGTHLQWQYAGDPGWTNLAAISTLRGEDGRELEVRNTGGYVQTRLTGGTWTNLIAVSELKGDKGDPADNPIFQFDITALASDAVPTASISGTYPNLTVHLGIPRGEKAASPVFGFQINALAWDAAPTASVSGTYPNLTVTLGIPKGKDATDPVFSFSTESLPAGSTPSIEKTGSYPNLSLKFGIPAGTTGAEGRGPVVLANGNYGNWDAGLGQFVDSGVPAVAAVSEASVTFTQAEVRANITTGESLKVLMGKIRKWFADLGALAFKSKVDWDTDIDNAPYIPDMSGLYTKPSLGIPKTDLASGVQTSLNKADTALQAFTETDPVYSADKAMIAFKSDLPDLSPFATHSEVTGAVSAHDGSPTAHNDLRSLISTVEAIARGRLRAKTFPTKAALLTWLSDPGNVSGLQVGDNFYIDDVNEEDFWWNGVTIRVLGIDKVDLTDYYKKSESDAKFALLTSLTNYYTKTESDNKYVEKISGKGLSTFDFNAAAKGIIDFEDVDTSQSSLTNMTITKQITCVTIAANQSLSFASVAVPNKSFVIVVLASVAAKIIMPQTSQYINMSEDTYDIAAGAYLEILAFYISVTNKYHLAVLTK